VFAARKERVEIVIEDPQIQPLQLGKPAVIVTAHVGAWQYVAMLGQLCGVRLTSLYAPEINPRVRPLFLRLRESMGCHWLSRDESARALLKELAAGNCVGFAADTRFDQGRMVEFCGQEAMTNTAAARLALRFGCPLIAVRCDRLPGQRYRMVLAKLIEPEPDARDADAQALRMTREMNREFERWIRRDPGRWVCMKRRWPREIEK
jgi:KDO2-lipid IV(A) lauroyltransferase